MLKIHKGEPWVMWPDNLVDQFIDEPANRIFEYSGDYNFNMKFELLEPILKQSSLIAKLPNYFGLDLFPKGVTFVYSYKSTIEVFHEFKEYKWEVNKIYDLDIRKTGNKLEIIVNGDVFFDIDLIFEIDGSDNSHIVFGAGNFPKNGFNLNYITYNIHYLAITKDNVMISEHDFKKFIHGKSFDLTDNCNFIYQI
jgi:hypothetical protein